MTLFRRRHERFGVAPRSRFPAETFEKDMPRKSVHRRNSLVVPKNNDIIFAAVLRDIAFTEIHYVALQAAQHADTSVKLPTQFRKLRVQPLQFFPADTVIHVAARMFADRNRLKSELQRPKHIVARAVFAVAVICMCMQILNDSHFVYIPFQLFTAFFPGMRSPEFFPHIAP